MDMGDVGTGLVALGAGQAVKDSVTTMLNPSAEYLGQKLLQGVKAPENLARVMIKGAKKLGDRPQVESGQVPPRVLKGILEDAPFAEDELQAEYLSGILAASWSGRPRDDRGVSWLATLKQLSNYSIRAHYVFYSMFRKLFSPSDMTVGVDADALRMLVPYEVFYHNMEFQDGEDWGSIASHSILSLSRLGLLDYSAFGDAKTLRHVDERIDRDGMILAPTSPGVDLFLWSHGLSNASYAQFLKSNLKMPEFENAPQLYNGALRLSEVLTGPSPEDQMDKVLNDIQKINDKVAGETPFEGPHAK